MFSKISPGATCTYPITSVYYRVARIIIFCIKNGNFGQVFKTKSDKNIR